MTARVKELAQDGFLRNVTSTCDDASRSANSLADPRDFTRLGVIDDEDAVHVSILRGSLVLNATWSASSSSKNYHRSSRHTP